MQDNDPIDELYDIDERIHNAYTAHGSDGYDFYTYVAHDYEDELTVDEYETVVDTVEAEHLVLYPTLDKRYKWDGASGKAFAVLNAEKPFPGADPELEPVLRFKPHQIPDPYDEDHAQQLANRDRNRELLDYFSIRPWEDSGIADDYADHDPFSPSEWLDDT